MSDSLPSKDEPLGLEGEVLGDRRTGGADEPLGPLLGEEDSGGGAQGVSDSAKALIGKTLDGRYEILEVIGRGGMGVIYRARQTTANREVAIKVLRHDLLRDRRAMKRFENEAKIISRLRHPNTLRLYDCRFDRDGEYIVTELLTGISLHRLINKKKLLPIERCIHVADQVAAALSEAHAAGIIHRDIKPDNIYIDWVAGQDVVKVIDFGVAKMIDAKSSITGAGMVVGTPSYLSPEQAAGKELTPRSDVYALGVLMFHMLTGMAPFRAMTMAEVVRMHLETPPPPMVRAGDDEQVPPDLEALVREMLAKAPDDRPVSVVEVRDRLKAIGRARSGKIRMMQREVPSAEVEVVESAPAEPADPSEQPRAPSVAVVPVTGLVSPRAILALLIAAALGAAVAVAILRLF